MAVDGGWSWADSSGLAAILAVCGTIASWIHLNGRHSNAAEELGKRVDSAQTKADAVGADLASYKAEAVEKFVPRAHLDQMENRLIARMDQQDARVETNFQRLWERIDRAFFHHDPSNRQSEN